MTLCYKINTIGLLNAKIGVLLPSLTSLLRDCDDSEILEHVLSLLSTLLNNRLAEVKKEHDAFIKLRDALVAKQSSLISLDFKVIDFLNLSSIFISIAIV